MALFLFGYLVGSLVGVVGARGLVFAVGGPVDADVSRAGPGRSLDHVCHVRPPGLGRAVLDEMSEPRADNGLQPTPLPNTKLPLTCDFMSSMVAVLREYGFTAARPRS